MTSASIFIYGSKVYDFCGQLYLYEKQYTGLKEVEKPLEAWSLSHWTAYRRVRFHASDALLMASDQALDIFLIIQSRFTVEMMVDRVF